MPFERPTIGPVDTPYFEMSNWSRTALPWANNLLMCVMQGNPIEEAYSGVPPILGCAPLTMEELHRDFEREHTLLNQTEWPGAVTEMFERKVQQLPHTSITRVVCLGLGSFSTCNRWRPRSRDQLVCLTILVEILNRYHAIPKQHVYVQDPGFINEDVKFLKSLGYTYLPDPAAFNHINRTTLVFGPVLECNINTKIFALCHPALYIGSSLEWVIATETESLTGAYASVAYITLEEERLAETVKYRNKSEVENMPGIEGRKSMDKLEIRWLRVEDEQQDTEDKG